MHKLHSSSLWHNLHPYFGICNSSSRHRSYSLMNSTPLLFLYICASHPHLTHLLVLVKGEFKLEKERVWESRGRLRERESLEEQEQTLENQSDSVFASATAIRDFLQIWMNFFIPSLYFVSLLNNWILIEKESACVFSLWVLPWSLT